MSDNQQFLNSVLTFESASVLEHNSCLNQHETFWDSSLQCFCDRPADDVFPFQAFACSQACGYQLQMDDLQN